MGRVSMAPLAGPPSQSIVGLLGGHLSVRPRNPADALVAFSATSQVTHLMVT